MLPANDLFLEDSIEKRLSIVSDDETINLTNEDIHSEQFQLKESICSEQSLKFGSCEANSIEFTIANTVPAMTGKWLTVTITPYNRNGTAGTAMTLGRFKVFSDKPSADREKRTVIAYDKLFYVCKKNYRRWYRRTVFSGHTTLTVKQFRDAFFTKIGITQDTVTLPNDGVSIKKAKVPSKLTGKDILTAICEINGVFGHIGRDNNFKYLSLSTNTSPTAIGKTYTISVEYSDNTLPAVDRIEMLGKDGEIVASVGSGEDNYTNKYTIDNNFIVNGMLSKSHYESALQSLSLGTALFSLVPLTAEMKGHPRYEVGDRITYSVGNTTKTSFILNRTMKGIQDLRDTYDSMIEEYYSNEPNAVNTKTAQMQSMEYQIGAMEDFTDTHLEKLDDGTIIVRDENLAGDEETGSHCTRSFCMWSQNNNVVAPDGNGSWATYRVVIECDRNFDIVDMQDMWDVRVANIGGKTYYSRNVFLVMKGVRNGEPPKIREKNTLMSTNNPNWHTEARFDNLWPNPPADGQWGEWLESQQIPAYVGNYTYFWFGHQTGADFSGFYGMSRPDKSYPTFDEFNIAVRSGEINPPELKNGDVILPTGSTQQETIDNLSDLAKELSGTSDSGSDTSTENINNYPSGSGTATDVASEDKQQLIANSIKNIKDGLNNWISDVIDNGRGKIVAVIKRKNAGDGYIHASTNLITSGDTVPTGAEPNDLHCEICDNSGIEMSMNSVNVGTYTMRVTRYGYDCKLTSGHTAAGEPTVFDQFIIAISGLTIGTQYTFSYKLGSATYDPTSNTYSNTTYNQATVEGVTKRYGRYGVMYSNTTSPDMTDVPTFGSENAWNETLKWQNFPDLQMTKTSFSNTITATATTMYMVFRLEPIVTHNSPLVENFWVDELKEANMEIKFNTIKVYGEDNTWYEFEGGGSGGTTDYDNLENKPSINSVTLSGNKTTRDLGMIEEITQAAYDLLPSADKLNPDKVYYIKDAGGSGGGGGGGGSSTLAGLTDVDLTSPSNGQVLEYDSVNQVWKNANASGGTTVVANPSGEATDTLNKLQVGNTIYGIEGGSGGGSSFSTEVLWENTNNTTTGEQTLSKSIDEFDFISVWCGLYNEYTGSPYVVSQGLISVDELNELYSNNLHYTFSGFSDRCTYLDFHENKCNIVLVYLSQVLLKVVGIKLGSSGGGRTKTLLWGSMPFSYPATQQTDASLSADIKDFDEIVVYGGWTGSNIYCFAEQKFDASVLDSLSTASGDLDKQFVMQMNAGATQFIRISKGSADNIIHFRYNGIVGIYAIVGIKY